MSQSTDPSASRADTTAQISRHVAEIIRLLGEDIDRDGLRRTPHRVAEALQFLTRGYQMSAGGILSSALFEQQYSEMILVKDIELFSLCEHHMLPFFGKAHIAYMPQDRIVGLSKLARVVDVFAQRLQVQERLTVQIAEAIQKELSPMGVGVVIEATHLCMVMRGVQKQNSVTCTSSMLGEFLTNSKTRAEFMRLIK